MTLSYNILEEAKRWRSIGAQVAPATEDGLKNIDFLTPTPTTDPKAPRAGWKQLRTKLIPDEKIEEIFSQGRTGLAVVTGVGFREDGLKLGMIEIDDPNLIDLFLDTADSAGVKVVDKVWRQGYVERTPGGGYHAYYFCSEIPKNTELAKRPAPTEENPKATEVLIETRGTGGLSIVAPSHGSVHLTGKPYEAIVGSPETIPVITPEEQEQQFAFARIFDEMPAKEVRPTAKAATVDGDRPGDKYNDQATLQTVIDLLGAKLVSQHSDRAYLCRAGKDHGVSFTYWIQSKQTFVFTSSTILEAQRSYSPFAIYAHFNHEGDFTKAAKALYAEGYGKRPYVKLVSRTLGNHDAPDPDDQEDADPNAIPSIQLSDTLHIGGNRFWRQEGFNPTPLSNGIAWITEYVTEELGPGDSRHVFRMAGKLADGTDLPLIDVPTDELGNIQHWTARNGAKWARFTLEPGIKVRDEVRFAIQAYSNHLGYRGVQRYSETGWVMIDGEPVFRTHNAPIGKDGIREDVEVNLPADFAGYSLPTIPTEQALPDLGRKWLRLLDLGPDATIAPLIASHVRAILGEILPADNLVYLHGLTGGFKTEASALIMAHFGAGLNSRNMPLNFEGTQNSIQAALWRLKDVISVIDDMAPGGTRNQIDAKFGLLDNLGRMAGNRAGRTRSNADMTAKQTYFPRGLVMASGEDLPRGHSASARMTMVEITTGSISSKVLTDCQQFAGEGVFAQLTAAYIQSIAANWEEARKAAIRLHSQLLSQMRGTNFRHRRTGDAIAPQLVAIHGWFTFLQTIGAIDKEQRDQYVDRLTKGLIETGQAQDSLQQEANPTEIFISAIRSAVLRGDAHLLDQADNYAPVDGERYGWRKEMRTVRDHIEPVYIPRGAMIGWVSVDTDALYLDPESAFAVAQRLGKDTGRTIPTTVTTLGKRLLEAKHIVSAEAGRVKTKRYIAGTAQRVWHMQLSAVFPDQDAGETNQEPTPFDQKGVA